MAVKSFFLYWGGWGGEGNSIILKLGYYGNINNQYSYEFFLTCCLCKSAISESLPVKKDSIFPIVPLRTRYIIRTKWILTIHIWLIICVHGLHRFKL